MNFDLNPPNRSAVHTRAPRRRKLPVVLTLLILAAGLAFLSYQPSVTETEARVMDDTQTAPSTEKAPQAADETAPAAAPEPRREVVEGVIKPGDTVTALLGSYLTPQQIHALSGDSRKVFPLSSICAGQPYKLCILEGEFESFLYEIDKEEQLLISRKEQGFGIDRVPIDYTVETEIVSGAITSNLFAAVAQSGEAPELAIALADIFAWDVDFILDIREGDSFQALVEKRYREGRPAGYGRILAAEFVNQGESYQAVLFKDGEKPAGYYDPDGRSLRKAFLKAPLSFTRISSGFTMRRYHPITKTWKAHPAIDYAAPTGTPIKTVGDGSITRIGYTRGNGNFIEVRHTNGYTSLYLHMNKFAKGMGKGKRVTQGQVIGYVGSTGLATGPHLCFRMRKNGAPVNPYKIKAPSAPSISNANMASFRAAAAPLLAQLEQDQQIRQARLSPQP